MKQKNANIFIVEDDIFFGNLVKELLKSNNYTEVEIITSGEAFLERIDEDPDIVILDHHLGRMNGIEILKKIKSINPNIQVIFLSAQEKLDVAIKSLKYGAYDYLEKSSGNLQRLVFLVHKIVSTNKLIRENVGLKRFKTAFFVLFSAGLVLLFYLYFRNPSFFS